jgi:hypothetical protein
MNIQLEARGWLARMWGNSGHSSRVSGFSAEYKKMEKEMQIYRLQLHIQEFDPVIPLVKLVLGLFAVLLSLLVFLNV